MSFFRRKSEKHKSSIQAPESSKTSGLSRSSSLKIERSPNSVLPSPKLWKNNNDGDLGNAFRNGSVGGIQRPHTLLLSADDLKQKPGSALPPDSLESPIRTASRLSRTLREIIHDKDGLSCFIEFMKSEKAEQLIQFWCDAESFQAATFMRLRSHALQSVSKSTLLKRRSKNLLKKSGSVSEDAVAEGHNLQSNADDFAVKSNTDDFAVKSSNKRYEETEEGENVCSEILNSDIAPSTGNEKNETHSSRLLGLPDETHNAKPLSTISNFAISHLPSSANTISPIGQNQNNSVSLNKNTDLDYLSESSERDATNLCDITMIKTNHERIQILETLSSSSSAISTAKHSNQQDEQTDIDAKKDMSDEVEKPDDLESKQSSHIETEDLAAKLRKSIERDAVTIFSNYIAKDAPKPIGVKDDLRADAISKICREDGQVDPECFSGCQEFVVKKMESQYFQTFKDSAYHSKHQINVLTSTPVYLPDILLAENALCYFLEYMEQEGASDLMQLWLAVDNFQQQLTLARGGYDSEQAQNDAMVIYDKYFSLQATNPMGFDDKLRFLIEENICREGGPMPDCFTEAKTIVLRTLDKIYFSNYLQSQVYYRYLSDLVSTVQMAEDMHHKPKCHRRTGSDASSEHSVSSQSASEVGVGKSRNTLLAVDTRKGKKTAATAAAIEGDFSMTMDMFNPDDLWKRTSPGGMSLGCVDELGQFVSNFESDGTDKRKGSGFLKRWKDKDKEQEEVALRIAQMIINDVNCMTQSCDSLVNVLEEDREGDNSETNEGR